MLTLDDCVVAALDAGGSVSTPELDSTASRLFGVRQSSAGSFVSLIAARGDDGKITPEGSLGAKLLQEGRRRELAELYPELGQLAIRVLERASRVDWGREDAVRECAMRMFAWSPQHRLLVALAPEAGDGLWKYLEKHDLLQ